MADAIMMWYIKKWKKGHPCWPMSGVIIFWWRYQVKFFGVARILKKRREFVNEYKKIYLFSADMWMWVQILQRKRFPFSVLGVDPKKFASNKWTLGTIINYFCVYVCVRRIHNAAEIRSWGQSEEKWVRGSLTLTFPNRYPSLSFIHPTLRDDEERHGREKRKKAWMNWAVRDRKWQNSEK